MRVLIDANVLYPTVLREIVLGCAAAGMFEPRWSDRICEEWARAAAKLSPAQETFARGEVAAANARFPAARVAVPDGLVRRLWLPDPDDVHVLAAAIAGSADAILTMNAADFPRNILAEEGLSRVDPDGFLRGLYDRDRATVAGVVEDVVLTARRLSGQDWTAKTLLKKARLHRLARALA